MSFRLPLSRAQLGVWYGHHLDPSGHRYNLGGYFEIDGPVDSAALASAVRTMVAETDAYRVTSLGGHSGVEQRIDLSPDVFPFELIDLSGDPAAAETATAWMAADMSRPVDLGAGPLTNSALFTLPGGRAWWYLRGHHLVTDAYAITLTSRRTCDVYNALLADRSAPASDLGRMETLAAEEADYRASDEFARDRDYWLRVLAERPAPVLLGTDAVADDQTGFLRSSGALLPADRDRLYEMARRTRTPWSIWLIAAVAQLVHRLSGRTDIILGLLVTGRTTRNSRRTPGMTANVVPLRVTVPPDTPLGVLVDHVWTVTKGALKHQRYRYEDMRRDLGLGVGDPGIVGPLVNVIPFAVDISFGNHPSRMRHLSVGPVDDLSTVIVAHADELVVDLHGREGRYRGDELDSYRWAYRRILTGGE